MHQVVNFYFETNLNTERKDDKFHLLSFDHYWMFSNNNLSFTQ